MRIVHIVARLNVGGTSIHILTLAKALEDLPYVTTVVRGQEGEREGTMDDLAADLGVRPALVECLRRDPGWHDLRALLALVRILRRERPHVVHTHAAKGGTLGRVAALIACNGCKRRAVRVHTFHGHSLTGYFSSRTTAVYRTIEQVLATRTDRLIAVSAEVRDDLVRLGVAPAEKFVVIPYGFDLSRFAPSDALRAHSRASFRAEFGIDPKTTVVTLIARLVPIKRVDRFLQACAALSDLEDVRFVVAGDGELHDTLRKSPEARALGDRLIWAGFRQDVPQLCFASDVVALSSDQEGTPISLIEAAAAGLPTVSTIVSGARRVIREEETGFVVARDGAALGRALRVLVTDPPLRAEMGAAAQVHAMRTFSLDRMVRDLDHLYRECGEFTPRPAGRAAS